MPRRFSPLQRLIRPQRGITLIEVLVVIAIIAVLISLLLPSLRLARQSAERAQCLSNQHQINVSWTSYATDNDGFWPLNLSPDPYFFNQRSGFASGWIENRDRINPYVADPNIFYCPATSGKWFEVTDKNSADHRYFKGWDVIPIDAGSDAYATVSYSIIAGHVRTAGTVDFSVPYRYFSAREQVYDPPNGAADLSKMSESIDGGKHSPSDIPFAFDAALSRYPSSITTLKENAVFTSDWPTAFSNTSAGASNHVQGGFQGIASAFVDGRAEWRTKDEVEPRVFSYNIPPYGFTYWY